jgi:N-acyl amino acid synthase of PEP-CTERM/exosortase system
MTQAVQAKSSLTLASTFRDYFQVLRADTDLLREVVFRIRYQVYCAELGFENPKEFPDRLERDAFDPISEHCLLRHRLSGEFAGCVRLIRRDSERSEPALPLELHCGESLNQTLMRKLALDRTEYGEISRLAVPAQFRRRRGEAGDPIGKLSPPGSSTDNRHLPLIPLGLYLAATSAGLQAGLEGVFAMMEPRLARHLRRFGFLFQQAGDVVDYRGERAAYYLSKQMLFEGLHPEIFGLLQGIHRDLGGAEIN